MPDPIQVESAFQELMLLLETTESIRHRHTLIREFLKSLEGEYKTYETYVYQVIDEIPPFFSPVTWSGLDPRSLEAELGLLENISDELRPPESYKSMSDSCRHLRGIIILLYACLNDVNQLNIHLDNVCGLKLEADSVDDVQTLAGLNKALAHTLHKMSYRDDRQRRAIEELLGQLRQIQNREKGSSLVPVVEKYDVNNSQNQYGRLRRLTVEMYGPVEGGDQLVRNFRVYGTENSLNGRQSNSLMAARKLFEANKYRSDHSGFKGGASFELSGAIHNGESANLAIAALWYSKLLDVTGQRERFEMNPGVAVTGDIDEDGFIQPVDDQSIGLKVRAAFFSWAELLVVPYSQRQLFEQELEKLREEFPKRNLDLIGVNQLREVFYDRRLAIHNVQGRIKYFLNRAKSQKYRTLSGTVIVVLLAIIGWLIFGPIDQNPVDADYEGEHMMLKNQYGQTIQSLEVGSRIVETVQQFEYEVTPIKMKLFDITGDGINEVFYARSLLSREESGPEELVAYSVSGDSLIWKKTLLYDIEFPNKPDVEESGYIVYSVNILDNKHNASDASIIATLGHVKFFPGLILKLNARTGRETGRFIHTGRIKQMETIDIDADGEDEIVGLGQNNSLNEITVFFALEPDQVSGHSHLTEEYKVTGYHPAKHLHYIQIPQTVVGRAFKRRVRNNSPVRFYINYDEEMIRVRVNDFLLPENDPFQVNQAGLLYMFGFDFQLKTIGTSSYYDLWAKNLYEDGRIPFEPNHEYLEAFKDSVLYWDGEGFVYEWELSD